jgi:hypothetical protein
MRHTVWHECERAGIDAVTCVAKNELHGALGHKSLLDVASVDMRRRSRPAGGGLLSLMEKWPSRQLQALISSVGAGCGLHLYRPN